MFVSREPRLGRPSFFWFLFTTIFFVGVFAQAQDLALVHVNVVPMDRETVLSDQTLIIADGTITAIGPAATTRIPEGVQTVDGQGGYLIPGMADLHTHVNDADGMFLLVAHGITTTFNLNGSDQLLELRQHIRAGDVLGPTVYSCATTMGGDPPLNSRHQRVPDPETAREMVRQAKKDGYDAIKIYSKTKPEVFPAVIEEADRLKLPVFGHVPWEIGEPVIAGGLDVIAHAEEVFAGLISDTPRYISAEKAFIPNEASWTRLDRLARLMKEKGTYLVANTWLLTRFYQEATDLSSILAEPENAWLPPSDYIRLRFNRNANRPQLQRFRDRMAVMNDFLKKAVPRLQDQGVVILMGSDAPFSGIVPGHSGLREVAYKVEMGMRPYQALATATRNVHTFFTDRLPDAPPFGLVQPGFRADLVLLEKNPLADINAIFHRKGVVVAGVWRDQEYFERGLADIAAKSLATRKRLDDIEALLVRKDLKTFEEQFAQQVETQGEWLYPYALTLYHHAKKQLDAGDGGAAVFVEQLLTMAVKHLPDEDFYLLLAQTHGRLSKPDLRKQALEKALELAPERDDIRDQLQSLKD